MGKQITLTNISKKYTEQMILKAINFKIEAGERVVLLGPSGSGKSTLLRMIAGLESITSGELYLDGELANNKDCGARNMAMVFQNYALYPHMTVAQNISFSLNASKLSKQEIADRLDEALNMLGLTEFRDRLPKDLSGGQRQRTALARAIVKRSDYFLLDEPLSNLDVRLRLDARKELVKIHEKYQQTFIYVTHDQIEAMTLADRIVLLNDGDIQMIDSPQNVYLRPNNVFSATFIGSPGMNILAANYQDSQLKIGTQTLELTKDWFDHLQKNQKAGKVLLGIRPEHLTLSPEKGELKGKIKYRELLGQNYAYTLSLEDYEMTVLSESAHYKIGDEMYLQVKPEKMHFFSAEGETNLGYPFDIEEGENIDEIFTSI